MNICQKHGTQYLIVCKSCLRESGGGVVAGELKEILDHFAAELGHNEKWLEIHLHENQPDAAERRREHCEKLRRWLDWLRTQRG